MINKQGLAADFVIQNWINPDLPDALKDALACAVTTFVRDGYDEAEPIIDIFYEKEFLHQWDGSFIFNEQKDIFLAEYLEREKNL